MCSRYNRYVFGSNRFGEARVVCCKEQTVENPTRPYSEQGAIPESCRVQMETCPFYTVRVGTSSSPCINNPGQSVKIPSNSVIPIPVQATSASQTTALLRTQAIEAASNPTDPATRFEQYFRPKPPQPPCPERLPNKDPIRPDRPCVGTARFAGSVQS